MTEAARTTGWDRRRERARRELAAVAVRLFDERGFAETTVDDVIEAADDYSASTFFRLFPRKEDAVFFDAPARLAQFRAEAEALDPVTWKALRGLLVRHAAEQAENLDADFNAARMRLYERVPSVHSRYLEWAQEYELVVRGVIARARGADPAADVFSITAAAAIVGAYRAGFAAQVELGGPVAPHTDAAFAVLESRFLRGLGRP